jgi:hypothetical protein
LLHGVQQSFLNLYLNGGDYFHNTLLDNALGNVSSNYLYPLYLQKLYAHLLQEGKSLDKIIQRCNKLHYEACSWCIFDYIDKKRDSISPEDRELILTTKWRFYPTRPFFSIDFVRKNYLGSKPDNSKFIQYFEEKYINGKN